jgi:hypothetical protein
MPNWVDQEFVVKGPREDIERFCTLALTGDVRGANILDDDGPTFHFDRVCPIPKAEARACQDEHRTAILLQAIRSHTQAQFSLQSSWTYPGHFYATRLLRDWPTLQFCCAINEDMGNFQGLIAGIDGMFFHCVESADAPYDRRRHLRRVRALKRKWADAVEVDRPWIVVLPFRFKRRVSYDVDATFDECGNILQLRSEAEVRRLIRRRTALRVFRRSTVTGDLRQVRAYRRGNPYA